MYSAYSVERMLLKEFFTHEENESHADGGAAPVGRFHELINSKSLVRFALVISENSPAELLLLALNCDTFPEFALV
jgi:hypothetical protein